MGIFRVQSKLFAGTAGIVGAAQSISAGTGDNVNAGIKAAQDNLNTVNTAYTDSKKALQEGFNKAKEANKELQFRDYVKSGEGQSLFDAAKNQRTAVTNAATNVGNVAGKDVGAMANTNVTRSMAKKEVGIGEAIGNTWKKGAGGKAALIAGGAGLLGMGALAAKGAFGGQKEFSDDTKADLKEAALIGGGVLTAGGTILAAKKGYLGKPAKELTEKAIKAAKDAYKGSPKKEATAKATTETAGKKLTSEEKAKIRDYRKKNHVSWDEAAKKLGLA